MESLLNHSSEINSTCGNWIYLFLFLVCGCHAAIVYEHIYVSLILLIFEALLGEVIILLVQQMHQQLALVLGNFQIFLLLVWAAILSECCGIQLNFIHNKELQLAFLLECWNISCMCLKGIKSYRSSS